ncbi:MAG: hypothetical protein ACYTFV_02430 [Planctomycetota bacterium]|jgi:hypothetical protein
MSTAPVRLRRALLAAVGGLLVAACSSTGSSAGTPARVTYRQFADSATNELELRSESHTDRLEFSSTPRSNAATKIMRDDFMQVLLDGFDDEGYSDFARPGPGPKTASGDIKKVIEIDRDGVITHVATSRDSSPAESNLMARLTAGFFSAYNATKSYQTIEDANDRSIFLGPAD